LNSVEYNSVENFGYLQNFIAATLETANVRRSFFLFGGGVGFSIFLMVYVMLLRVLFTFKPLFL